MSLSSIARKRMTTEPDLTLYITYKNYSSWSLRAWLLMRVLDIPFTEMHADFTALRAECPMNLRRAPSSLAVSDAVRRDVARAEAIFNSCLTSPKSQSNGLFLMGKFSAVDAFYAPLATRLVTYQLSDHPAVAAFMAALENLPAWQEWQAAAMREMAIISADEVD